MNLKSVWLLSQAAGRHMVPLRRGKIIHFGSLLSFQGGITVPAYAASKGALAQLTKALSNEWAQHNVQVNAICPGYVDTDMCVYPALRSPSCSSSSSTRNARLLADPVRCKQISERIPAGRWGEPRDFAGPVVFLASDASQYVCGELLVVDGVGVSVVLPFLPSLTHTRSHTHPSCPGLDGAVKEGGTRKQTSVLSDKQLRRT